VAADLEARWATALERVREQVARLAAFGAHSPIQQVVARALQTLARRACRRSGMTLRPIAPETPIVSHTSARAAQRLDLPALIRPTPPGFPRKGALSGVTA
jgi:hypothetical protein